MTPEEKQMIKNCRVLILGYGNFAELITSELLKIGFVRIEKSCLTEDESDYDIVIIIADSDPADRQSCPNLPQIYPFDFIEGAAAIVVLPGDSMKIPDDVDLRVWTAKYMSGYSVFWNTANCDWLWQSLRKIEGGEGSEKAQRTAAKMCTCVSANIAMERDVKHFPRFYLIRNLE